MMKKYVAEYAELNALSNFSFLEGGSHPEELIEKVGVSWLQGHSLDGP